jgi:hypothetical protein
LNSAPISVNASVRDEAANTTSVRRELSSVAAHPPLIDADNITAARRSGFTRKD